MTRRAGRGSAVRGQGRRPGHHHAAGWPHHPRHGHLGGHGRHRPVEQLRRLDSRPDGAGDDPAHRRGSHRQPGSGAGAGGDHRPDGARRAGGAGVRAARPVWRRVRGRGRHRDGTHHLVPVLAGAVRRCDRAGAGHRAGLFRRSTRRGAGHDTRRAVLRARAGDQELPESPPVTALRGVSFTVAAGELVAIVGPSGSGKTTLLHVLGTLDRPSSGRVLVTGLDVAHLSDRELAALRATRIGFVFQQFFLAEHATVLDNVADGLLYTGVGRQATPRPGRRAHWPPSGSADRAHGPTHPAVRRPAAAGGHRPGPGRPAGDRAGRRAHRQPRQRHRRGHHRPARRPQRGRHHHPRDHPRPRHRRPVAPPHRDARRAHRRRHRHATTPVRPEHAP